MDRDVVGMGAPGAVDGDTHQALGTATERGDMNPVVTTAAGKLPVVSG
ncbi:MAG: hypothetical protein ABR592_12640 [Nitriliruptorales bacterium]